MKAFHFSILTMTLVLTFFSFNCSDDSSTNPDEKSDFRFPLTIGNTWTYNAKSEYKMITPAGDTTTVYSSTGTVRWTVISQEKVLSQNTYKIQFTANYTSGTYKGETVTGYGWYAERGDSLLGVAYNDMAKIEPIIGTLFKQVPGDHLSESTSEPSAWNATILVYPLSIGKDWIFMRELGLRKTVEAYDSISVPAGKFGAFRIIRSEHYDSPLSEASLTMTSWMSENGYVKAVMSGVDYYKTDNTVIGVTTPTGSIILSYEEAVLTGYQLK
jgi:hypothetical protein